jgi:protein SCO1/2/putative membrane protein
MAVISLRLGLKGKFEKHAKIARWTYPIWVYVSVTGVVVYLMLYRISW